MHVKKGDKVIVIAGKEKGKTSTVVRAIPGENKVILEGLNMMKRHRKPQRTSDKGSVVDVAMPIDVSNVKLAEKREKPTAKKVAKKTTKKA